MNDLLGDFEPDSNPGSLSIEMALLPIEFANLFTVSKVLVRELSEDTHLCKVLTQGTGKNFFFWRSWG